MNFEVHTNDGTVDLYEDFFAFGEPHYGLWVRAETRHEFHMEAWGDLRVSCHVRRISHGLVDQETESREIVKCYTVADNQGCRPSSIKIRPDQLPGSVEEKEGAKKAWLRIHDMPSRRPRTLTGLQQAIADRR